MYDLWGLQQAKCKHSYFRHIETLVIKKPMENTSENSAVKTYLEKKNESNVLNHKNRYKTNNSPHEQKFQTYSSFHFYIGLAEIGTQPSSIFSIGKMNFLFLPNIQGNISDEGKREGKKKNKRQNIYFQSFTYDFCLLKNWIFFLMILL